MSSTLNRKQLEIFIVENEPLESGWYEYVPNYREGVDRIRLSLVAMNKQIEITQIPLYIGYLPED